MVVAVAANGYRLAGFVAALSAAVWFDFFLTRPYERFSIFRRADIETTVLLLVIGVAVTEIAVWGRRQHAVASRRAGYLDGIGAAAQAVAAGGPPSDLIDEVSGQLTGLLSLQACRFQYGVAGIGQPARLQHDGTVTAGRAGPGRGRRRITRRRRHGTAGGKRGHPAGPVPDDARPRGRSPPPSSGSWPSRSPTRSGRRSPRAIPSASRRAGRSAPARPGPGWPRVRC